MWTSNKEDNEIKWIKTNRCSRRKLAGNTMNELWKKKNELIVENKWG